MIRNLIADKLNSVNVYNSSSFFACLVLSAILSVVCLCYEFVAICLLGHLFLLVGSVPYWQIATDDTRSPY